MRLAVIVIVAAATEGQKGPKEQNGIKKCSETDRTAKRAEIQSKNLRLPKAKRGNEASGKRGEA